MKDKVLELLYADFQAYEDWTAELREEGLLFEDWDDVPEDLEDAVVLEWDFMCEPGETIRWTCAVIDELGIDGQDAQGLVDFVDEVLPTVIEDIRYA